MIGSNVNFRSISAAVTTRTAENRKRNHTSSAHVHVHVHTDGAQYSQHPIHGKSPFDFAHLKYWKGNIDRKSTNQVKANTASTPTIVIQIDCEMANILCKLTNGFALKWMLEDVHNIRSNVIVSILNGAPKTTRAWNNMRLCFPKLRELFFVNSTSPELKDRQHQQHAWLGGGDSFPLGQSASNNSSQTLKAFALLVANTSHHPPPSLPVGANITLPFILTKLFATVDVLDRFFDRLQDLFEYDTSSPACCGPIAHPDEHIFHARGFVVEVGEERAKKLSMLELSPNKTVKELLKNHKRDEKIAVVSRFPSFGQLYVDRMLSEGLDARFVNTTNGEHSFCFLMSGRNEIVGGSMSTFVKWASYLGNASKARIYFLRTPQREVVTGAIDNHVYNYTNPHLRDRIFHEVYNSEEIDDAERDHTSGQ